MSTAVLVIKFRGSEIIQCHNNIMMRPVRLYGGALSL